MLTGAVAAFVGGGVWAAIIILAKLEVGWVAWGIGGLVGISMSKVTPVRNVHLGVLAAALAAAGLLAGKALTIAVGMKPAMADEIAADDEWLATAAMHNLRTTRTFPAPVQTRLDQVAETDTLSDALWADMLAASRTHVEGLDQAQRKQLAAAFAEVEFAGSNKLDLMKSQMSFFDILWFGLAIATAWKIMSRPEDAPESAPEARQAA